MPTLKKNQMKMAMVERLRKMVAGFASTTEPINMPTIGHILQRFE